MHVYESVTRTLTHTSASSSWAYTREKERKKESTLFASPYSCPRKKASYSLFATSSIHRNKKKKKNKNTVMPTVPNNMTERASILLERERERERESGVAWLGLDGWWCFPVKDVGDSCPTPLLLLFASLDSFSASLQPSANCQTKQSSSVIYVTVMFTYGIFLGYVHWCLLTESVYLCLLRELI